MEEITTNEEKVYTVADYICGRVNYDIPDETITAICKKRGVDETLAYPDGCKDINVDLLYADLLKWIVLGPSRKGDVSDSDNGWKHSEGSFTLSKDDKKLLTQEANAIYEENGEPTIGRTKIRVHSLGIMGARFDLNGNPLPRIIKA